MKKIALFLIPFCVFCRISKAAEGMWLPIFLKQLNESDMQLKGMKVSAEDIYSVNKSSMKDAVVLFGGGCTAEIISNQGLLLTNHHCGFSQIQSHSSIEKNYLKNGFWASKMEDELPCPGLTVTFIIRIEDVTNRIMESLSPGMNEQDRDASIKAMAQAIEKKATEGSSFYTASVKPFYNGNQFFLFVMETFKDIRMVGAPPDAIGEFGGDTDNWMWPRHNGDFSLFRIYTDKNNNPTQGYSPDNIPYQPRYFFPVSLKGIKAGDFTMVYGFPGKTTEYIPSFAVKSIVEVTNPARIKIRTVRLGIIDEAMHSSDQLRIQYASKQRIIANGWKKWQGEIHGLSRLNTIERKQTEEQKFQNWCIANNKPEYANLLSDFEKSYTALAPLAKVSEYINEAAYGVELLKYVREFKKLVELSTQDDQEAIRKEAGRIAAGAGGFFKNFDVPTDKKLFAAMMKIYYENIDSSMHPKMLTDISTKYKGDFSKYAEVLYEKSAFSDSSKIKSLMNNFSKKKLKQLTGDPAWQLVGGFNDIYSTNIETELIRINGMINILNRKYMAAQMEMEKEKKFYPDANLTLRVTYGNVDGYVPRDGVKYLYYTTLDGIMQKEDSSVEEFEVPAKLKELYIKKDYGRYGSDGTMPVAFVASNHTTGGNSGSPVINANGELIGINFDRVWEGTMSDIDFDPEQCRNISLDIRYTLFIIDKFAGCTRLIDEMKIIE